MVVLGPRGLHRTSLIREQSVADTYRAVGRLVVCRVKDSIEIRLSRQP